MRYAVLCLLVGCTPSNTTAGAALGEPCSKALPCDSDGVCDFTAVGGPVCIDTTGDNDNDGIPNLLDRCPNAPGDIRDTYDEDNDGIGDPCDKCPIAPPPSVPDLDNDDVDSPCDPDPDTAGDKILFFDGFGSAALDPKWNPSGSAAWTPEGGELVVDANQPDEQYLELVVEPVPSFAIEASYRIDGIEASATTHKVGARGFDSSPAGVANFECGVITSDVGTGDVVALETNLNGTSAQAQIPAFSTAPLYETAAYATNASVGCTVIGDNMPVGTTQNQISPASLGTAALGVRAVTARFEWVLVVGRPTTGTGGGSM